MRFSKHHTKAIRRSLSLLAGVVIMITLMRCGPATNRMYYSNGKLKAVYTTEKGKIHGVYREYYPSGALKEERTYVHGELTGAFKQYHEHGTLAMETDYVNGLKAGTSTVYHHNGKPFTTSHYLAGIKIGEEQEFDTTGTCVARVLFDSLGNLLFHQTLAPEKHSRVYPIVRVDSHTVDIGRHCKMVVSFGYDLHGEVTFKVESLNTMKAPTAKIFADTSSDQYRVNLHFKEAGLHKVRVTIQHQQLPGDTLTADGVSKELEVVISDKNATDI
jgi:MORN repeat variant